MFYFGGGCRKQSPSLQTCLDVEVNKCLTHENIYVNQS